MANKGLRNLLAGATAAEEQIENAKSKTSETTSADTSSETKINEQSLPKRKGGRPTNAASKIESRKQYTLTLQPSVYAKVMDHARASGLSFARYTELALREYMQNH